MKVYPAVKAAIAFALGITISCWLPTPFPASFLITLAFTIFALLPLPGFWSSFAIYAALIGAGSSGYLAGNSLQIPEKTALTIICRVDEPPVIKDGFYSFPARVLQAGIDSSHLEEFNQLVWVHGKGSSNPALGATLMGDGELTPFHPRRNPGEFNLKLNRASNGFVGEFHCRSILEYRSPESTSPIIIIRKWLAESCDKLAREDASMWKGLLLGFRRDIDPVLLSDLQVTGLTHLIALSGLNIGFLALGFIAIGSIFRLTIRVKVIFALVLVIGYALIIPDRGATIRATVMTSALLSGFLLKRWSPVVNTLGLALLVILALKPLDLFDPGLQLSLAAVAGISLFTPEISKLNNWRRNNASRAFRLLRHWLLVPMAVSITASVFVAPLTSNLFSSIPLGGPLFNLVAVPLMGVLYAGIWMAVLSQPFGDQLAFLLADGVRITSFLWRELTHNFATIAPELGLTLPPLSIMAIFGLLIWAGLSRIDIKKRLLYTTLGVTLVLLISIIHTGESRFRVLFLDVGHGDSQIWMFPDGSNWLIDAGPAPLRPNSVVERSLRKLNIDAVDLAVASHPDADHIGGFNTLFDEMDIAHLAINQGYENTETLKNIYESIQYHSIIFSPLSEGDSIAGLPPDYRIKVLNPPVTPFNWSENDLSIVLLLTVPIGKDHFVRLLTTGDIEETAEKRLLGFSDIRAELLKIPHHGSPTSSTQDFVNRVAPDFGVISRGRGDERVAFNGRELVLERYQAVGTDVHFTDREGAILFEASSDGWRSIDWRDPGFWKWLTGKY